MDTLRLLFRAISGLTAVEKDLRSLLALAILKDSAPIKEKTEKRKQQKQKIEMSLFYERYHFETFHALLDV